MHPNPNSEVREPLIEILEDLVPQRLHTAAWGVCSGKNWYFGNSSNTADQHAFWKMDLDGNAAFDAIWLHSRQRCEALAGTPLRVIRQYANGHTYGLGGRPHVDDSRPGTFTLLYYPNPEWRDGWDGETVFFEPNGELALAVRVRPNRAVFFDSRIIHAGRAPSRDCFGLRVTVAFKLEAIGLSAGKESHRVRQSGLELVHQQPTPKAELSLSFDGVAEVTREGSRRVYRAQIPQETVTQATESRLAQLSQSVRLPGFRPGKIPQSVMQERYGAQARSEAIKQLSAELIKRALPQGSAVSGCEFSAGAESGDVVFTITVTHLPDLPDPDFSQITVEKLNVKGGDLAPDAAAFLRERWRSQLLDQLSVAFDVPVYAEFIEREFASIWKAAESQGVIPKAVGERAAAVAELRGIAERRLRLGLVAGELGRRYGIEAAQESQLEDKVLEFVAARSRVQVKAITPNQLQELMNA